MRLRMVTKEHSLEPATLIPLAIKAQEHQSDIFCEAAARLMQDPDSFAWPPKILIKGKNKNLTEKSEGIS